MVSLFKSKLQEPGRRQPSAILRSLLLSTLLLSGIFLEQFCHTTVMAQNYNNQRCGIKELSWLPQSYTTSIVVNNIPQNLGNLPTLPISSQTDQTTSDLPLQTELLIYSTDSWMFDLFSKLPNKQIASLICAYSSFPRSTGHSLLLLKYPIRQANLLNQLRQRSTKLPPSANGYLTLGGQGGIPKYFVKALNDTYLVASSNYQALTEIERQSQSPETAKGMPLKLQQLISVAPQPIPAFWYYKDGYQHFQDRYKGSTSALKSTDASVWLLDPYRMQMLTIYTPTNLGEFQNLQNIIADMPALRGSVSKSYLGQNYPALNIRCKTRVDLSYLLFLIGGNLEKF